MVCPAGERSELCEDEADSGRYAELRVGKATGSVNKSPCACECCCLLDWGVVEELLDTFRRATKTESSVDWLRSRGYRST
jgi:hypothetical protein